MKRAVFAIVFVMMSILINAQKIVWKEIASLPMEYYGGEAVSLGGEIYFVGSVSGKAITPHFYKYNPKSDSWVQLANIPDPTMNLALAAVDDKIYAIGGDRFKKTNRMYDPKTDSWSIMDSMPTGRQHISAGTYGNNIYVAGGLTSWTSISKKLEVYNVKSNIWLEKTEIPSLRNNSAVIGYDDKIFVFGGAGTEEDVYGDINTLESYDVKKDQWELKKELPIMLFKPGITVVGKEIFLIGGQAMIEGQCEASTRVFVYKPDTDTYIETTPLPKKNVFFGCASIGDKIYVIGGTVGGMPNWDGYTTVYEGHVIKNPK
jgi:N-acetylneuraminic acid mutarotase